MKINISTSEDITFEGGLLLGAASNYSDGIDRGFRPAIRWAMIKIPNTVIRSGLFNLKNETAKETSGEAVARAREVLFTGDCLCAALVDQMLEVYERES